ncbi:MAG: hypothetical protein Q8O31_00725, partial [Rhodocyclaceae bacterium]|nr:hypothetical protein [Rhodocyclaceae bacterium]
CRRFDSAPGHQFYRRLPIGSRFLWEERKPHCAAFFVFFHYKLGAVQMDRAGNSVQSIEYRPSGIILTAKPEIRDGVVDLDLSQELSSFVATATGVNTSPTLIKRALQSRFQLQPGEVVILAGLEENKEEGQVDRLPFVGWETGKQDQNKKSEILILVEVSRL